MQHPPSQAGSPTSFNETPADRWVRESSLCKRLCLCHSLPQNVGFHTSGRLQELQPCRRVLTQLTEEALFGSRWNSIHGLCVGFGFNIGSLRPVYLGNQGPWGESQKPTTYEKQLKHRKLIRLEEEPDSLACGVLGRNSGNWRFHRNGTWVH